MSQATRDIFASFNGFFPDDRPRYNVAGFLEAIVRGIHAKAGQDNGIIVHEKSRLAMVAHTNRNSIMRQEGWNAFHGAEDYYKIVWLNVAQTLRENYVPFEGAAAATTGGLEDVLEGQIVRDVRNRLSTAKGVVKAWRYMETQPSLFVPRTMEEGFITEGIEMARELLKEKIYAAYSSGYFKTAKTYLSHMRLRDSEPELKLINISSAYQLALQAVPDNNRQRGLTLGAIDEAIHAYSGLLRSGLDMRFLSGQQSRADTRVDIVAAGEDFVTRLRQDKSQPKDYWKQVREKVNQLNHELKKHGHR